MSFVVGQRSGARGCVGSGAGRPGSSRARRRRPDSENGGLRLTDGYLLEVRRQTLGARILRLSQTLGLEDSKSDIGWGSQIRSYVLDQSRIKDLRTNVETGNTQAVLDGDLDQFVEASLKMGLSAGNEA